MYMPEWKKVFILVAGLLEILVFSGTILGWTSLKLMLKNEGIYDYKCQESNEMFDLRNSANTSEARPRSNLSKDPIMSMESQLSSTSAAKESPHSTGNYSLKINFTFINNDPKNMQGRVSTIVIPFESVQTYNNSFIYNLLRDPPMILKSNATEQAVSLVSDRANHSSLDQFIDLYMKESLEPSLTVEDLSRGCHDQEVVLNLAFSVGSFCMGAAAFIWGFLLERWGLRIVRLVINLMIATGAFMLCFTTKGSDWLLFPAILIMSLGGVPIRIANMQFSNLYPSKRSTIISVYSGAFSASSIIYVILEHIYTRTGLSFFWVNFILVILSLMTIPFTLFVLPADKVRECTSKKEDRLNEKDKSLAVVDQNHNEVPLPERDLFQKRHSVFLNSPITLQNYKSKKSPSPIRRNGGYLNAAFVEDEVAANDIKVLDHSNPHVNGVKLDSLSSLPPVNFSPPLSISLYSFAYNLHQLWFSWMITYMLMYVGSMNLWTERITEDRAHQSTFVNLYGLFQVLALAISPLAGLMMDWQMARANSEPDPMKRRVRRMQSGFWPLFITSITLLICVLCHYFDSQEFIYISIVFITIYRAFLLAVGSAFLRVRFHGDHFNRLLGIMSSVSAVISLLQIPLFKWESSAQSNVLYVNIFNTIVAFLVMSNPLYLLITPLQKYFLRKEDEQTEKASRRQ